jgi:hypothetical protein
MSAVAIVPSKIIPEVTVAGGSVTIPVNVGESIGAFRPIEFVIVVVKLASSLIASANSLRVLRSAGAPSTSAATAASAYAVVAICVLLVPANAVGAVGVPVNVGEARLALRSNAVWVAVDTGLLASEVLSTFPRPTCVAVTPETVPVKVGEAVGALVSICV